MAAIVIINGVIVEAAAPRRHIYTYRRRVGHRRHPGCIFADHGNDQRSWLISPVA